jgi:hypothetical protein
LRSRITRLTLLPTDDPYFLRLAFFFAAIRQLLWGGAMLALWFFASSSS